MQHWFRKSELLQLLILGSLIFLFGRWAADLPDRVELGPRVARIHFEPAALASDAFGPLRLAGAWAVSSDDPRVGGVSGLAVDGDSLLALTDSGVLVAFEKPPDGAGIALVRELPGGPGDPAYKSRRDSEALASASLGEGWWVGFENRHQLWLFDQGFGRAVRRIEFGARGWWRNRGIEAVAAEGNGVLALPEKGDGVIEIRAGKARSVRIDNPVGRISDAARLPTGELLVLNRRLTPLGFSNSIATLGRTASGFRYGRRVELGLLPLDNAEALASEKMPDGRIRLWLMTDDNFQRPMRTLLVALDMPAAGSRN